MEDEDAVANLYMDRGYLFFQLVPIEGNVLNDSIDLEIRLFEGPQAVSTRLSSMVTTVCMSMLYVGSCVRNRESCSVNRT